MKRFFDLLLTLPGIVIIFPLILLTALLVRIKIGRPIFFIHERAGLHGKPFNMYKFRTMTDARDADDNLLPDAERLIPFGCFLRSSSLDELPELLNVLKGDMSLIGPRPLIMAYLDRYTPEQAKRNNLQPGISGWAQVNGRNALSWEDRFNLDIWYVENQSLYLDVKILWMTLVTVLRREGISEEGEVTMSEFMGNSSGKEK
ncbi:MAG: sugar transferase [Candidatus Electrothrix sp. AR4]|nr:sugar transferase [Candidatus Electrothrix sp. AR4]